MTEAPRPPERGARSTWIGQETLIEGKITTREDVCIQGRLKGSVESTAAVLIPEGGQVEADILARNVTIHGRVTGDVEATEKAEIGASGVLTGGILAATVVVHAGATFEGAVRSRGNAESKPAAETTAEKEAAPRGGDQNAP